MFIRTADGNLINTRHIVKIKINEPEFEQENFAIAAYHIHGSEILSRHNTKAEAEKHWKSICTWIKYLQKTTHNVKMESPRRKEGGNHTFYK